MYKVNILINENALLSTVFGPFDMLIQAGVFWNAIKKKELTPCFDISITSVDGQDVHGMGGTIIKPHTRIKDDDNYDIIIIPSEGMNIDINNSSYKKRVDYIEHMYKKGATIASICTGAFVIASTELLNNKVATTHWALESQFKHHYPKVNLDTNLLIADNNKIITAGGVTADKDLCMHLISKFCGHEIALQTARCTLVNRTSREQTQYKTFSIIKNNKFKEIVDCQIYIENHLKENITVQSLAQMFSLSQRTLTRRFKQATTHSLVNYIQQLKIEKAKYILERENKSFDYIANELGYENVSFFRGLFKKYVGITPKEYKKSFFIE